VPSFGLNSGLNFNVDLSGKSAIVTGAGAGVGKAIAHALARSGAAVAVNDLNPDRAETVADEIINGGGRAIGIQGDVGNRFQVSALIEKARDEFGHIHIFVNAAGVYKAGDFAKIDEWDWRRHLEVNLTGAFFCTQLIGRVMADEGGGVIINIAAQNVTLAEGSAGYVASKSGLLGLTRQSARELAAANIRVNAVCPGNIANDDSPISTPNAQNRLGSPDDVAHLVLFLCSDAAAFITGQAITVDGGGLA